MIVKKFAPGRTYLDAVRAALPDMGYKTDEQIVECWCLLNCGVVGLGAGHTRPENCKNALSEQCWKCWNKEVIQ